MSKKEYNSISKILEDFLRMHGDTLKILQKISESVTTNSDTVIFTTNRNGVMVDYKIPSYSYLLKRMNELNSNVNKLNQIKNKEYNQPIFGKDSITEPSIISNIQFENQFYTKPNWFFENLMNPLLFVKVDISKYINIQSKFVTAKRLILELNTPEKLDYFNKNIKDKNDLKHDSVLKMLDENGIFYNVYEDNYILPPLILKKSGTFSVTNIGNNVSSNGDYSLIRDYTLTHINYNENNSDGTTTEKYIQKDDILISTNGETEYEVTKIDQENRIVSLALKSGFEIVKIGVDVLKIASDISGLKEVHIPIGAHEENIIFLKSVDPYYHSTTKDWGDGIAFSTKDLFTYKNDEKIYFDDFYKKNVNDFSLYLSGLLKENPKASYYGTKPLSPTLLSENFKIIRSDKLYITAEQDSVYENLINQYENTISEIAALEDAIKNNPNDTQANSIRRGTINQIKNTKLTPIKNDILAYIGQNTNVNSHIPEYKISGIALLPEQPYNSDIGSQEIIQCLFNYRYINISNEENDYVGQTVYDTNGNAINASISEWMTIVGPIRERLYNEVEDFYEWSLLNLEDPTTNNINHVFIPIQRGQKVQIRAKVLTEAGFPNNPITSDWSSILEINFPDTLYNYDLKSQSNYDKLKFYALKMEMEECCEQNRLDITNLETKFVTLLQKYNEDSFKDNTCWPKQVFDALPEGYWMDNGYEFILTPNPNIAIIYNPNSHEIMVGGAAQCFDLPNTTVVSCPNPITIPFGWKAIGSSISCMNNLDKGFWCLVPSDDLNLRAILIGMKATTEIDSIDNEPEPEP